MNIFPREFPTNRHYRPKRQAERRVFEALANANRQGFAFYEWRRGYEYIEVDFAVWIEGLGRFAMQVKGGRYFLTDGDWYLRKRDGLEHAKSCPLDETKLAALDLHDDIEELTRTAYNPFVLPVLVFPDMADPDGAIAALARRQGVYLVWGVKNFLEDLEEIVRSRGAVGALSSHRISREVHAVTDGLISMGETAEKDGEVTVPGSSSPTTMNLTVNNLHLISIRAQRIRCHL